MLIINAHIMPMSSPDIESGFVRFQDGRITGLGRMEELSGAADLKGKYLLPGFVDAHSHLGLCEDGVGYEGDDINECSDPVTPQLRALDAVNPIDRSIAEAREGGVTCVVASPGSANPIGGQLLAYKTIGRWIDKMLVAEPLGIKLAFGENPKRVYGEKDRAPMSRMASVALIRETLMKARRYRQQLLLEDDEDADPPELDVRSEALVPLLERKIRAHIHAHRASDILSAVRVAREFSLDFTIVHGTEGHLIADILARENIRVITGPMIGTRSKPELSNMEAHNAAALAGEGVEVAICSDHPEVPAQFLLNSAAIAHAEGMSGHAALCAITLWAAKAAGLESRVGSIETGKDADFTVFAGHPLSRYQKPELVFINGECVAGNFQNISLI
jgi:imidazolonepropionase-like amidohydrolase